MPDPIYGLSAADVAILKDLALRARNERRNPRIASFPEDVRRPGNIYVARIPYTGIPGTQTSISGTGVGTGTGTFPDLGIMYSVDCDIYKLDETSLPSLSDLVPAGFTQTIYNPNQGYVYGPQFCPVGQDKFGVWWVLGGRGTDYLRVTGATDAEGVYPARAIDYSDANSGVVWIDGDIVYLREKYGGYFLYNDVLLDAHLGGSYRGKRVYIAVQTKAFRKVIVSSAPTAGTGPSSLYYKAALADDPSSWNLPPSPYAFLYLYEPNGYPLRVGAYGFARLDGFVGVGSSAVPKLIACAELYDWKQC